MSVTHSKESDFLNRLTEITEANLSNEQFGVSELASEMGMSRSNLHRKLKSIATISISQFIRRVRLERAMEMLQETSSTISEVAFECGFHSVSYFTKCFHDHYGYTPGRAGNSEPEKNNLDGAQHHDTKPGIKKKQLTTLILSSSLFVILAVFVLFFIFGPFSTKNKSIDKSIAVLPFINDSSDDENVHFINGAMLAILDNLSKIEDLRVVSRTSVEQYRDNPKSLSEIAREMNVSYILEGSGQKDGDNIQLNIQLFDAINDKQVWSSPYIREILTGEIFMLQSEIAQLVAAEIEAVIAPEERLLIEKIPTKSQRAYDFYLKAAEEYPTFDKYYSDKNETEKRKRSEDLIYYALEYDSTFALAYAGLAWVNLHRYQRETLSAERNLLDSALRLADIALSYDNHLSDAYVIRGYYYSFYNLVDQAIEEYDKALEFNPNNSWAYLGKAQLYDSDDNFIEAIINFQNAASRDRGLSLRNSLRQISYVYCKAGFKEKSNHYSQQALDLDSDSTAYYLALARSESLIFNNNTNAIEILEKGYAIDSTNIVILTSLGTSFLDIGQFKKSIKYFEEYIERIDVQGILIKPNSSDIGYSYWQNKNPTEAEYFFDKQIEDSEEILKANSAYGAKYAHYRLAAVYAFRGEREKAYQNLRILNQWQRMSLEDIKLKDYPLFDSIRHEPEFQQILREVEAKYQAEHERVRQWLEENDML